MRSERLRQLQAIPYCPSIAPLDRARDDRRLQLVHPWPLQLAPPIDEFDVAQAIGSMLDGLAWLHAYGATHGAVGATTLVAGPIGGRLSMAGAFSRDTSATPADDVLAASALAFTLLVGAEPGPDATSDPWLAQSASPAVAEAVRAGLDPDAAQRPSAALLATMVRGEFLPPIWEVDPPESLLVRLQTSLAQMFRVSGGTAAAIGAVLAMVVFIAALAAADQPQPAPTAISRALAEEPTASDLLLARRDRVTAPTTTLTAVAVLSSSSETVAAGSGREDPPVVVLASASVAPNDQPRSNPTAESPPPTAAPTTTVVVKSAPTTTATSTTSTTTRRATSTTSTTKPGKGKGPKYER